jgi:hypothetical protein
MGERCRMKIKRSDDRMLCVTCPAPGATTVVVDLAKYSPSFALPLDERTLRSEY